MINICSIKRAIWLHYYNQVAYDRGLISHDSYLRMMLAINSKYQGSTSGYSTAPVRPNKTMVNKD